MNMSHTVPLVLLALLALLSPFVYDFLVLVAGAH